MGDPFRERYKLITEGGNTLHYHENAETKLSCAVSLRGDYSEARSNTSASEMSPSNNPAASHFILIRMKRNKRANRITSAFSL